MGLFKTLRKLGRHLRGASPEPQKAASRRLRNCRIEKMEDRQYLSAVPPIQVGAVYHEDNNGDDVVGDQIALTWSGGAPGAQLTRLVIDTDKENNGLSNGDAFFDIQAGGLGAFGAVPFSVVSQQGIGTVQATVEDGGTKLILDVQGWEAGEKLVISIDVDEQGYPEANAVAEGKEFEYSQLQATVKLAGYYDATGSDVFLDKYDAKRTASGLTSLPPDSYIPPYTYDDAVYTAGAFFPLQQIPLPSSLAGTVYEDPNRTNTQQSGEPGIASVDVTLYHLVNGSYVSTGRTVKTDGQGHYRFDNLEADTYQVRETQPSDYTSVGATAGKVGGVVHGTVENPDRLTGIDLGPGEDSVGNDFAENRPASIAGRVHVELNMDCIVDPGEPLLEGVTIYLLDSQGNRIAQTQTNAQGYYKFENLIPGTYGIEEIQPSGYLDGDSHVGSAGGAVKSTNILTGAALGPNVNAVNYDFCELLPASIAGRVHAELNMDCIVDPGEPLLGGVTIYLLDAQGNRIDQTLTDAQGYYKFQNLRPGTYGIEEVQPAGYLDGVAHTGTAGGVVDGKNFLRNAELGSGVNAVNYDFCELVPASISGRVHAELNGDCIVDPGEPLLAGVTIYLLNEQGEQVASTTTDSQGYYTFVDLWPGTYSVQEVQPTEYLDGDSHVGSAGGSVGDSNLLLDAVLDPGTNAVNYDFCELVPASLSGYVFQDGPTIRLLWNAPDPSIKDVRDGQLTSDDKRLGGVTLQLGGPHGEPQVDDSGNPILATTDANGFYKFTRLRPGTYTVIEYQPTGYQDGVNTVGTNGGVSVNKNDTVSPLLLEQLTDTVKENDAIVLIPIQAGDNAVTYNFSEVVLEREPAPPPYSPPPLPPSPPLPGPPLPSGSPVEITRIQLYSLPGVVSPVVFLAGAAAPVTHTWHLSVINGGQPRREQPDGAQAQAQVQIFSQTAWAGINMNQGGWTIFNSKGKAVRKVVFGLHGARPVTGDWNGDGKTKVGLFVGGQWFLDLNGDGTWDNGDLWAQLGHEEDRPVTGDWDGDGKTDIGIFGPAWNGDDRALAREPGQPDPQNTHTGRYKNIPPTAEEATDGYRALRLTAKGKLRTDLIDHVFHFGIPGDIPVAGDWNGDGITTVGVFREGTWYLDVNGDGKFDASDLVFKFGQPGDAPLVGDWNGDGITRVGVYRQGQVYLDVNGQRQLNEQTKSFEVGAPGDIPATGDFDGDGVDDVAVYHDGAEASAPAQAALPASGGSADVVRE